LVEDDEERLERMNQRRKQQHKERPTLGFGLETLGLGGLFGGIERMVDLASKLAESGGAFKREGELDLSQIKEGMKGVFGISIRTAAGGKPVVESFGNIRQTPQGPKVETEREPITDVFDEGPEVRVYAEMPGVSESDIKLDLKGDILDIGASNNGRTYHKEVLLPSAVRAETLTSSYKNGILEVRIAK
jgi:HSP20 family protein